MDTNKIKLSNGTNVGSLMLDSPQLPATQNLWEYEVWDIKDKDGNIIYHKDKTFENCWVKYGIMVPSTRGAFNSEGLNTNASIYKITLDRSKINNPTNLKVPVVKELEDKVPNFLCCQNTSDTAPLVTFWNRNLPDNETNRMLFAAIRDYFKDVHIGYSCNSLFGCYNNFSPHWAWDSQVQRLWGANTDWKITISRGMKGRMVETGVSLWGMFANTDLKSINIEFKDSAVIVMNNLFSSVKNDNWGTLDVTVSYHPESKYKNPVLIEGTDSDEFCGFIPYQMIKSFRSCQITQQGLDNIFHNSLLSQCTDITGCFSEHLRCRIHTVPHAYGCQPFEETANNTIQVSRPKDTTKMFSVHQSEGISNYDGGGALECFHDSGIEEVQCILDMQFVFNPSHIFKMFNSWRGSSNEGTRSMKRVRIKNIGNMDWDFNGGNGQSNNGKDFDEASVKYLFDNLRDQTKYREVTEAEKQAGKTQEDINNFTQCNRNHCKLYCPESWRPFITKDMLRVAYNKGWTTFINGVSHIIPDDRE